MYFVTFHPSRTQCVSLCVLFAFQRNEYIFSLMEPKKVEKRGSGETEDGNNKGNILERNEERKQHGEKEKERQVNRNKERGQIILGLRFSRKRLHFLFRGHGGVVEHWGFRGAPLADNQWHTLVLAISNHHVRLTVDCSSPLEM